MNATRITGVIVLILFLHSIFSSIGLFIFVAVVEADGPSEPYFVSEYATEVDNGDGTFTQQISSSPVAYYNGSILEAINTTIYAVDTMISGRDYAYGVEKGLYHAYFREQSSDVYNRPVAMQKGNYTVTYSPQDYVVLNPHKYAKTGTVANRVQSWVDIDNDTATYKGFYQEAGGDGESWCDVQYVYGPERLKTLYIIDNKTHIMDIYATHCFSSDYDVINLTFTEVIRAYDTEDWDNQTLGIVYGGNRTSFKDYGLSANGAFITNELIEFTNADNETVFVIPVLYAWDSNASHTPIILNKTISMTDFGNLKINIIVPLTWIDHANTTYPIYVDTTTDLNNPTVDAYIDYNGATIHYYRRDGGGYTYTRSGSFLSSVQRAYVEWPLSSISNSATVTNVDFEYHGYSNNIDCHIHEMMGTRPSTQSDDDSGNQAIYDEAGEGTVYVDAAGFPVASSGQSIDLGTNADSDVDYMLTHGDWFAIGIQADNEGLGTYSQIYTEEYGSVNPAPTLEVTYTVPNNAPVLSGFNIDSEGASGWDLDNNDAQMDWTLSDGDSDPCTLLWTFSLGGTPSTPTLGTYNAHWTSKSPGGYSNQDVNWESGSWADYDGTITIYMRAHDGTDYSNTVSDTLTGGIDGTNPTGSITEIDDGDDPSTISGSASDATSGVSSCDITIEDNTDGDYWTGDAWGSLTWLDCTGTTSWSYTDGEGIEWDASHSITITLRIYDAASNLNSNADTEDFTTSAGVAWNEIGNWSGTIFNSSQWATIEEWSGTLANISQWHTITEWSGTISNISTWKTVNEWSGSASNTSAWTVIDEWSGTLSNTSAWFTIALWTGTLANVSGWIVIATWGGQLSNTSGWKTINEWSGTILNTSGWFAIEEWSGSFDNSSAWFTIDDWSGTLGNSSDWKTIEEWSGSISNTSLWHTIEDWDGDIGNTSAWHTVETWSGSLTNTSAWHTIDEWSGTIANSSQWHEIDSWSGTVSNSSTWHTLSEWDGTVANISAWHLISEWSGTITNTSAWHIINEWSGTVSNTSIWHTISTWSGALSNASSWTVINEWSGGIGNTSAWHTIGEWSGLITNATDWHIINYWSGTIDNTSAWFEIEQWGGSLTNTSSWHPVEQWSGTMLNGSSWTVITEWSGDILNDSTWHTVNEWSGDFFNGSVWMTVGQWSGTIYNVTEWMVIEEWSGDIGNYSEVAWRNVSEWSGELNAPDTLYRVPEAPGFSWIIAMAALICSMVLVMVTRRLRK